MTTAAVVSGYTTEDARHEAYLEASRYAMALHPIHASARMAGNHAAQATPEQEEARTLSGWSQYMNVLPPSVVGSVMPRLQPYVRANRSVLLPKKLIDKELLDVVVPSPPIGVARDWLRYIHVRLYTLNPSVNPHATVMAISKRLGGSLVPRRRVDDVINEMAPKN